MRYYYAYAVCGKCVVSRPLFLALYVVGISVSLGGSLIAGGLGGVLTGCWFRGQLQWCMYWADVQSRMRSWSFLVSDVRLLGLFR
jgi:hypothetical protein